jgi:hypothetical protein
LRDFLTRVAQPHERFEAGVAVTDAAMAAARAFRPLAELVVIV